MVVEIDCSNGTNKFDQKSPSLILRTLFRFTFHIRQKDQKYNFICIRDKIMITLFILSGLSAQQLLPDILSTNLVNFEILNLRKLFLRFSPAKLRGGGKKTKDALSKSIELLKKGLFG